MTPDELTEHKVFEILTWLAGSDARFAQLKGELENAEILQKRVRERAFLEAEESTVAERKAEAEGHEDVQAADDHYVRTRIAYERLKASRESAERWYDIYRTISASRRAGIVT